MPLHVKFVLFLRIVLRILRVRVLVCITKPNTTQYQLYECMCVRDIKTNNKHPFPHTFTTKNEERTKKI